MHGSERGPDLTTSQPRSPSSTRGPRTVAYRILGDRADAYDAAAEAVARALMSWRRVGRLETAERLGLDFVELTSRPKRQAANGLYQSSLGFELRQTGRLA